MEYDEEIIKTDFKTIVDNFIYHCSYDANTLANLRHYVKRVIFPSYLGFGAIGNLLVIIFLLYTYKKKISKMNSYHFLIVNLAIVDLLVCIFVPVVYFNRIKSREI